MAADSLKWMLKIIVGVSQLIVIVKLIMDPFQKILVIWNNAHIEVEVEPDWTVADLKYVICKKTGLKPFRQRFINLELKEKNIPDTCKLTQLELPNNCIVLRDSNLDEAEPSTSGTSDRVANVPLTDELKVPLQEITTAIEQQRVIIRSHPRPGKNLLVVDVDLAIYDCTVAAEATGYRAVRPYLQQFLATVSEEYDIIIWSATNISAIMHKMQVLGIKNNRYYTILSYFDRSQMILVPIPGSGVREVKDLEAVWRRFQDYNYKNTVICDDQSKNFFMNPTNGIQVTRYSYIYYENDKELVYLAKYLKYIANFSDLSAIDHSHWKTRINVTI